MPRLIKQSTAIREAYALKGHFDRVYRRGDWWYGTSPYGRHKICHVDELRTVDHNGHSTRVYQRDWLVGTVYGVVKF